MIALAGMPARIGTMRIYIFLLPIVFCTNAFATVGASTVFALDASGLTNGACGYDSGVVSPGTDRSQGTSYFANGSDLASTNGTTNPCVVTSASHNFTSADNGNFIIITSGTSWTVQRAEIVSTSGNAATLDRTCGAAATLSSGTWGLGGACSLNNSTAGTSDSTLFGLAQPGNKFWMKLGSYTAGVAIAAGNVGGTQNPIYVNGFQSTRGDTPTGTNRPTLNMGANTWTITGNWQLNNMIITGTSANVIIMNNVNNQIANSKILNTSTTASRVAAFLSGNSIFITKSEFVSERGTALSTASNNLLFGNYIHDSNIGISISGASPISIVGNIISDNVTKAITWTVAQTSYADIHGNTIYGAENKLGVGVTLITATTNVIRFFNNIIYGFTTGVTHPDSGEVGSYDDCNDYFDNTTDVTNWTKGPSDIAANPGFKTLAQITDTGASTSGTTLTANTATFNGKITDNVDYVYVSASTGGTTGKYLITAHTNTTLTGDNTFGSGSSVSYQITTGHNFQTSSSVRNKACPTGFPFGATITNTYPAIGASQQMPGYPRGREVNK